MINDKSSPSRRPTIGSIGRMSHPGNFVWVCGLCPRDRQGGRYPRCSLWHLERKLEGGGAGLENAPSSPVKAHIPVEGTRRARKARRGRSPPRPFEKNPAPEFAAVPSRGDDQLQGHSRFWWHGAEPAGLIQFAQPCRPGKVREPVLLSAANALASMQQFKTTSPRIGPELAGTP